MRHYYPPFSLALQQCHQFHSIVPNFATFSWIAQHFHGLRFPNLKNTHTQTLFTKLRRAATWKTKKGGFSTWDSFVRENWALHLTPVSSFNFLMKYCGVCTGNSSNEYAEGHYAVEAGGMPNDLGIFKLSA